jgi:hypothetical protein
VALFDDQQPIDEGGLRSGPADSNAGIVLIVGGQSAA